MKTRNHITPLLIAVLVALSGASALADGVVFATEEDVSAFDQMIEKNRSRERAESDTRRSQLRDKVKSVVGREKNRLDERSRREGKSLGHSADDDRMSAGRGKDSGRVDRDEGTNRGIGRDDKEKVDNRDKTDRGQSRGRGQ